HRPSRDHVGTTCSSLSVVSRRGAPPSASIIHRCLRKSLPGASKAIRRPSGDQDGEPGPPAGPPPGLWVSCCGFDPSASAIQRLAVVPLREEENASRRPSGDSRASSSRKLDPATNCTGRPPWDR